MEIPSTVKYKIYVQRVQGGIDTLAVAKKRGRHERGKESLHFMIYISNKEISAFLTVVIYKYIYCCALRNVWAKGGIYQKLSIERSQIVTLMKFLYNRFLCLFFLYTSCELLILQNWEPSPMHKERKTTRCRYVISVIFPSPTHKGRNV